MPIFYFDIQDGKYHKDDFGDQCADLEEAVTLARTILPDLARDGMPDGDRHVFICRVRDETNRVVYHCELAYRGTWPADLLGGLPASDRVYALSSLRQQSESVPDYLD